VPGGGCGPGRLTSPRSPTPSVERFAVLGFSFGGPYALAVAHALGSRVRALGLVSAMGPLDRPGATNGMMTPTRLMFTLARTAGWLARPAVAGMTRSITRGPDRFFTRMSRSVAAPDRAAHAAYWRRLAVPGYLGGPFADRSGGLITFEVDSRERAEQLVSDDPFDRQDLLQSRWLKEWTPD
jgi:hypothetical protein